LPESTISAQEYSGFEGRQRLQHWDAGDAVAAELSVLRRDAISIRNSKFGILAAELLGEASGHIALVNLGKGLLHMIRDPFQYMNEPINLFLAYEVHYT
jgi:hypothetical protein